MHISNIPHPPLPALRQHDAMLLGFDFYMSHSYKLFPQWSTKHWLYKGTTIMWLTLYILINQCSGVTFALWSLPATQLLIQQLAFMWKKTRAIYFWNVNIELASLKLLLDVQIAIYIYIYMVIDAIYCNGNCNNSIPLLTHTLQRTAYDEQIYLSNKDTGLGQKCQWLHNKEFSRFIFI